MDLKTTYLGLKLRTPLVPAASPLSEEIDNIKQMEDAGAAAVVMYSLFEEQLRQDRLELDRNLTRGADSFAEATLLPNGDLRYHVFHASGEDWWHIPQVEYDQGAGAEGNFAEIGGTPAQPAGTAIGSFTACAAICTAKPVPRLS